LLKFMVQNDLSTVVAISLAWKLLINVDFVCIELATCNLSAVRRPYVCNFLRKISQWCA
jgi:hypothetical protein